MVIDFDDKYEITTDVYNYILNEKAICQDKESKNFGKEYTFPVGYYQSLPDLLQGLFDLKMRQSTLTTLNGLSKAHTELVEYFKSKFPSLKEALKKKRG